MHNFKAFRSSKKKVTPKSELDLYLDEPQIDGDDITEYDVLYYWKTNESRYPYLSLLVRDVLSIPITTVASEGAFSIGGRILTRFRSSTIPENIQTLICCRNWLHDFLENPSGNIIIVFYNYVQSFHS